MLVFNMSPKCTASPTNALFTLPAKMATKAFTFMTAGFSGRSVRRRGREIRTRARVQETGAERNGALHTVQRALKEIPQLQQLVWAVLKLEPLHSDLEVLQLNT